MFLLTSRNDLRSAAANAAYCEKVWLQKNGGLYSLGSSAYFAICGRDSTKRPWAIRGRLGRASRVHFRLDSMRSRRTVEVPAVAALPLRRCLYAFLLLVAFLRHLARLCGTGLARQFGAVALIKAPDQQSGDGLRRSAHDLSDFFVCLDYLRAGNPVCKSTIAIPLTPQFLKVEFLLARKDRLSR